MTPPGPPFANFEFKHQVPSEIGDPTKLSDPLAQHPPAIVVVLPSAACNL
jgi:hypothetical protein